MKFFPPVVIAVIALFFVLTIAAFGVFSFVPKERWQGYTVLFVDSNFDEKDVTGILLQNGFSENDFFSLASVTDEKKLREKAAFLQSNDFFRYTPKHILLENYFEKQKSFFFDKDKKAKLYYIKLPESLMERRTQAKRTRAAISALKDAGAPLCGIDGAFFSHAGAPVFATLAASILIAILSALALRAFFQSRKTVFFAKVLRIKTKVKTALSLARFDAVQNLKKMRFSSRIFYGKFAPFPIRQNAFLGFGSHLVQAPYPQVKTAMPQTRSYRTIPALAALLLPALAAMSATLFLQKISKNDLYLPTPKRYNVSVSEFDLPAFKRFEAQKSSAPETALPDLCDFIAWAHFSSVFPYRQLGSAYSLYEDLAPDGEFIQGVLECAAESDFFDIEKMLQEQKKFASVSYSK